MHVRVLASFKTIVVLNDATADNKLSKFQSAIFIFSEYKETLATSIFNAPCIRDS